VLTPHRTSAFQTPPPNCELCRAHDQASKLTYSFADTKKSARDLARDDLIKVLTHKSGDAVNWLVEKFNLDLSKVSRLGGHSEKRTHRGGAQFPGMTITYALMEKVRIILAFTTGADCSLKTSRTRRQTVSRSSKRPRSRRSSKMGRRSSEWSTRRTARSTLSTARSSSRRVDMLRTLRPIRC